MIVKFWCLLYLHFSTLQVIDNKIFLCKLHISMHPRNFDNGITNPIIEINKIMDSVLLGSEIRVAPSKVLYLQDNG